MAVHFATSAYDQGPVVLQTAVPVMPNDSPDDLAARVFAAECASYPQAIRHLLAEESWWEDGQVYWRDS